jgi:hypothetical protein
MGFGSSALKMAIQSRDVLMAARLLVAETLFDIYAVQKKFSRQGFVRVEDTIKNGCQCVCWILPIATTVFRL